MKKLYVVDVSSMFFRAYYAIPPLNTKSGLPTNALYGFLSMTVKLIRQIKPDYMAFCFDVKEPSFRRDIYPDYKANRSEMPEDLVPQIPYVKQLTDELGIPRFEKVGFEADDVIGTLTKFGRKNKVEVIIVSGDKDFAQLIEPFVSMYDSMREKKYDVDGAIEKWGVHPDQMIDYLALVGDSSDNIPGVKGIGPKGAQKLLAEFKTLDGVYKNIEKITGKSMKAKLIEFKDNAYMSQELVTIDTSLDFGLELDQLKLNNFDKEKLLKTLNTLEFTSFAKNLLGSQAPKSEDSISTKDSSSKKKVKKVKKSGSRKQVEWGPDDLDKNIEAYQEIWAILNERGLVLGTDKYAIQLKGSQQDLGKVLSKKHLRWKGFYLKEIWKYLEIENPVPTWDSMLAAYVVRAGDIKGFGEVYQQYLGVNIPDLPSPDQLIQAQEELQKILKEKLTEDGGLKVYEKLELPLAPILCDMEVRGVNVDLDQLKDQSQSLKKDIAKLEKAIHKESGESFNIASPKQLGQVLFGKMGLPVIKKTKTGPSTGSEVLEKLKKDYPICNKIIEFRELSKLKSTYVDALPQLTNEKDGRIHTRFRQAATQTGRLSSVHPNLQNIPVRTERGRLIRKAFVAGRGKRYISADYSQIELRVLAHVTQDPGLCGAFADDLDVHQATAAEVFGVKLKDVTPELRRRAKAVNFGIAYGQGPFGLAENLGISRTEAKEIITRYFERFSNVKDYMETTIKKATQNGYVETLMGRRRYLPELKSKNAALKKFGERAAINAPMQGTASDIVKLAMIRIFDEISSPMIIQVHDELLFECPTKDVEEESEIIKEVMESAVDLRVPLKVNIAFGANWEDAHS